MATATLSILIEAKNQAEAAFGRMQKSLDGLGLAMTAVGGSIVTGLGVAAKAAIDAEATQTRFETSLRNITNATGDQIAALREQQAALQRTTRFEDDAIASAQGFLATFSLSAKSIENLTPKLLDMAEGLRTAEGGTVGLEQASNMLGKALATGQIEGLQRVGLTIPGVTKAQQELFAKTFQLANQQERVAMLTKMLDGNFKGQAESAGKTLAGQIDILKNSFGDLMETVGGQLLPILTNLGNRIRPVVQAVGDWMAKNPQLTQDIIMVAAALGPLLIILPVLVAAITAIISPVGLAIIAIGLLVAAGVMLYQHWDLVKSKATEVWNSIQAYFQNGPDPKFRTSTLYTNFLTYKAYEEASHRS